MKTFDWYFDFISPYSYLQNAALGRIATQVEIRRRPVLFAGLLERWGQLGPAEIVPKRDWTFLHCTWLADRHGVPLTMPTMHPFNPLPLLRLSHALGNTAAVVDRLFAFVWIDGHVPTDRDAWIDLLAELAVDEAVVQTPAVKEALRVAGTDAVAANVFGVPTAVIDDRIFWGFDATDMLIDYLNEAPMFASDAMRAALDLPVGSMRPQRPRLAP